MLAAKTIEIRDVGTFIPAVAVLVDPIAAQSSGGVADAWLLRRGGYGLGLGDVLLARLDGSRCRCDPHAWLDDTMRDAHLYIIKHWDEIKSGDVVDVQFIRGDTDVPKVSERLERAL